MKITDNQIDRLDSLLIEGIVSLSSLPKGKNEYIDKVKNGVVAGTWAVPQEPVPLT